MTQARWKAVYATLFVEFGVTPPLLATLTDWQILELYWHKRGKDGAIEIPGWEPAFRAKPGPSTLEADLKALEMLAKMFGSAMDAASVAASRAKLYEKYGAGRPGAPANGDDELRPGAGGAGQPEGDG